MFEGVDKIILPGVGVARDFMKKINDKNLNKILIEKVKKMPQCGVCVGFQICTHLVMSMVIMKVLKLLKVIYKF